MSVLFLLLGFLPAASAAEPALSCSSGCERFCHSEEQVTVMAKLEMSCGQYCTYACGLSTDGTDMLKADKDKLRAEMRKKLSSPVSPE